MLEAAHELSGGPSGTPGLDSADRGLARLRRNLN